MPFSVKTYAGPSSLHGKGVFTAQDIPKGSVVWTFTIRPESVKPEGGEIVENTRFLTEEDFVGMSAEEIQKTVNHAWAHQETQKLLLMVDGCQWMNHHESPNCQYVPQENYRDAYSIATRDIRADEELLENYDNYKKIQIPWIRRLLEKYDSGRIVLEESIRSQ